MTPSKPITLLATAAAIENGSLGKILDDSKGDTLTAAGNQVSGMASSSSGGGGGGG
jgi:hypothetical protein